MGGETMKKIRLLIPLFIGLVAMTAYPAFARSSEEPVNVEEVTDYVKTLLKSQKRTLRPQLLAYAYDHGIEIY